MEALEPDSRLLILEPYYGGSHKKLIDIITRNLSQDEYTLITMSAKKWHWRARTSALYIATQIPREHRFEALFCSSVLPLAELLGLRPDLARLSKVLYFHENQLKFPVRVVKERDFQYGYNEILSCLAADKVLFNSNYNMKSFLNNLNGHLKLQPDYRIKHLPEEIEPKCSVIYYPIDLAMIDKSLVGEGNNCTPVDNVLHIVWPHRWEFDKNPDAFYQVLSRLVEDKQEFKVSILGEAFTETPEIFNKMFALLQSRLLRCGFVQSQRDYYRILDSADVVVSTAIHEFFGAAVMEAVYCNCIPVVPKRLSYKELYEEEVHEMYETDDDLYHVLKKLCIQKQRGNLNKTYKNIALQFESNNWVNKLLSILFRGQLGDSFHVTATATIPPNANESS